MKENEEVSGVESGLSGKLQKIKTFTFTPNFNLETYIRTYIEKILSK